MCWKHPTLGTEHHKCCGQTSSFYAQMVTVVQESSGKDRSLMEALVEGQRRRKERQVQNVVFFYSRYYKLKSEMWESCNSHRRQDKLAKAGSMLFYLEAIRPCLLIANVLSKEQCQHTVKSDYLNHSEYYAVSWSKKFCLCLYLLKIISPFLLKGEIF